MSYDRGFAEEHASEGAQRALKRTVRPKGLVVAARRWRAAGAKLEALAAVQRGGSPLPISPVER